MTLTTIHPKTGRTVLANKNGFPRTYANAIQATKAAHAHSGTVFASGRCFLVEVKPA